MRTRVVAVGLGRRNKDWWQSIYHSILQERLGLSCFFFPHFFLFFDLGRCKDACGGNPSWFSINWCSHSFFSPSPTNPPTPPQSIYRSRKKTTEHQNMGFHKVSPTICFLLSVLLLFLSLKTLSRELIQVAPYGKYFSSIMVLGFSIIASTLCRLTKFICGLGSCRR